MPRTAPPVSNPPRRPAMPPPEPATPAPSAPPARRPRPAPVPRGAPEDDLPPLCNGDRLTQPEFHRRYLATPETFHAELIEGMVFIMASPISLTKHAGPQGFLIGWLAAYAMHTPGLHAAGPATLIVDNENEVEPDAMLRLAESSGGLSRINDDDFLTGVPELVVEVAASSASRDLNLKKRLYARIGIPEYIVVSAHERAVRWFVLHDGAYNELPPDDDGVFRSPSWPGLWLPASSVWTDDYASAFDAVKAGVATDAHAAFVARLTVGG